MKNNQQTPAILLIASLFISTSCVQKMGKEGRIRPLEDAAVLQSLSRQPPPGTVPQSKAGDVEPKQTREDQPHLRISKKSILQGREQYEAYCMPCHGMSGYGNGMIVQRGFLAPPSYHIERLRAASDRHFFDVITHGYGAMYSYSDRILPEDRWAIVSYIRALQLSQNAALEGLSPDDLNQLKAENHL